MAEDNYRIKADMLLCQGHGVCKEECPEVFDVRETDDHYNKVLVKAARPGHALRSKVEDAVRYCPNQVLKIIEE